MGASFAQLSRNTQPHTEVVSAIMWYPHIYALSTQIQGIHVFTSQTNTLPKEYTKS